MLRSLVGSEMCIRDSNSTRSHLHREMEETTVKEVAGLRG